MPHDAVELWLGVDGNRRFKKYTTGSAVPLSAVKSRAKKAHRAQTSGGSCRMKISSTRPPHPAAIRNKAENIYCLTVGAGSIA
jgi:hypothetical protein